MNPDVAAEIGQAYLGFGYMLLAAVGAYFLKVIISLVLKRRVSPLVAPGLSEDQSQAFFPRLISLIGMNARPAQTFASTRLRSTIGLRVMVWAAVGLMFYLCRSMGEEAGAIGWIIVILVVIGAIDHELYEITYDRIEMQLPRWWFGRTTHRWSDLMAVTDRDPWFATFHFADGRRVKVHKYIVGYVDFMAVARDAIRNL